jgi:hypothetical protein
LLMDASPEFPIHFLNIYSWGVKAFANFASLWQQSRRPA